MELWLHLEPRQRARSRIRMKRVVILVVVIVALSACSDSEDGALPSTTSRPTRVEGTLGAALQTMGVDLSRAPREAAHLGSAQFCGYEIRHMQSPAAGSAAARRCFLEHAAKNEAAVFVVSKTSNEGDPIISIYRWSSDGHLVMYIDATRDRFGSGDWQRGTCQRVTTEFPNAPEQLPPYYFDGEDCERTSTVGGGA